MQPKINERFTWKNGRTYECRKAEGEFGVLACEKCAMYTGRCEALELQCNGELRYDEMDVVFVLIEGSPVCGRKLAQQEEKS